MGFMAWNKPYRHTAKAVTKHVYTTNHRANHENQITITTGIKRPFYI